MMKLCKGDRVKVDGTAFGRVVATDATRVRVNMEDDHNTHWLDAERVQLVNLWGHSVDADGEAL